MNADFNELHIEFQHRRRFGMNPLTGEMYIYMDKFFPCTMKKFKTLLKTVEMDKNCEAVKAKMRLYFQWRVLHIPEEIQSQRELINTYKLKLKEISQNIKNEKSAAKKAQIAPNLCNLYGLHDEYKANIKDAESEMKRIANSKGLYEKYIALIS